VERDEIEDEYERLLQDLAAAEQEVVAAEGKLLTLNDIGSQLEMRSNQLHEKVESLQNTKDAQDAERNDINSKVSVVKSVSPCYFLHSLTARYLSSLFFSS
jgi:predicted nuclease with TOPRIM domain